MRDGVLQPGMSMPALLTPPPDPHPDKRVQAMRDAWDMRIIAWDAVWPKRRPNGGDRRLGVLPNRA